MDPVLIGSTIFSTAAAFAQAKANDRRAKESNSWSEKMYEKQLQDNLKMSSPKFQVQRLREAGLNPALAYNGEQTTSPATSPSVTQNPSDMDLNALSDVALKEAQIENIEADTELKKADTRKRGLESDTLDLRLKSLPKSIQLEIDNQQADYDKKLSEISVNDWSIAKMEQEVKQSEAEIDKIFAQTDLIKKQTGKTDAEIEQIKNDVKLSRLYYALAKNDQYLKEVNLGLQDYGLQLTEKGIEVQNQQFYDKLVQDKELQEKMLQEIRYRSNVEIYKLVYDPVKTFLSKVNLPFGKGKPVGFGK